MALLQRRIPSVAIVGAAMCLVYTGLMLCSSHWGYTRGLVHQLFVWPAVLMLSMLFISGRICLADDEGADLKWIVGFAAAFGLLALWITPFDSRDIYNYVNIGWRQYRYGLNPYSSVATDIPGWQHDPMLPADWANIPSPYSFLFSLIARWACALSGSGVSAALLVFKMINLIGWAGTAALLSACVRKSSGRGLTVVLFLFLWNPLIVLQEIAEGHNDILMALFLVLAIYFALAEIYLLVIPALIAAALIKYVAIVVIPFAIWFVVKRRSAFAALSSLGGGILLFGLVAAPYLPQWREFRLDFQQANAVSMSNSLESALFYTCEAAVKLVPPLRGSIALVSVALRTGAWSVALGLLAVQVLQFMRARELSVEQFTKVALFSCMVVIFIGSSKFFLWYVAMFYPLALLLDEENWMRELMVAISVTQLFALTAVQGMHVINALLLTAAPMVWVGMRHWPTIKANLAGRWPDESPLASTTSSSQAAAP